jgi:hypothetical protein
MATPRVTRAYQQRKRLREQSWPKEDVWTGENEVGWFRIPRTMPLVLQLIDSKNLSGNLSPSGVYLELLARHVDNGLIEMAHEVDHAYAAGYDGSRAVRSWQERMRVLEKLGFIKTKQIGNQRYKYVLLIHPTVAIQNLYNQGKVPKPWWEAYRDRQIQTKEPFFEERHQPAAKVVPLKTA